VLRNLTLYIIPEFIIFSYVYLLFPKKFPNNVLRPRYS